MGASVAASTVEVSLKTGVALSAGADFLLELHAGRLQIRDTRPGAPGPLCVDFLGAEHRQRRRAGKGLLLARACGVRKGKATPGVLDATAGLGRDAWALACLGCGVVAVEQSRVVHALLADGLLRARAAGEPAAFRITLVAGDAIELLSKGCSADVVYLDPMFPELGSTALPGKEMQYLQELLPVPADASRLLEAALQCGVRRIVVKRPRVSPPLAAGRSADAKFEGKSVRFDVYLK